MSRCTGLLRLLGIAVALALTGLRSAEAETNPVIAFFLGYSKSVNAVGLSPNGRQAVSGGQDNLLRLWDLPTGLLLRTFDTLANRVNAVAFSPDGRQILTGDSSNQLRLWDIATGQMLKSMEGHGDEVTAVAFSANGQQALSGSKDKTVKLWDLAEGTLLRTMEGHAEAVLSVAMSRDGRQAISASKDKTLRLWDVQKGELIASFEGHADEVTSVAFSEDGTLAVSGGKDKAVKLWDLATRRNLRTLEGHADEVLSVSLSPDGLRILSGGKDKVLKLWDAGTGKLMKSFEGHSDAVTSAAFSADGHAALSGSLDKTLRLWDLEKGGLKSSIDLQAVTFAPNGYRNFFSGAGLFGLAGTAPLDKRLQEKGLRRGSPVFLRIFKADLEVELWIKAGNRFELFATYPICAWSGQLGPKLAEGDAQAPEGFYTIAKDQLHPKSQYHRAFNLGYPNLLDRSLKRTGKYLMIHGACASVGCYAMTDPVIDELWELVTAALNDGQERVAVHIFPFRMTEARLAAFEWHPWIGFWRELKIAYDSFEETRIPPQISVCNKRYAVTKGKVAVSTPALQASCPPNRKLLRQARSEPLRQ